MVVVLGELAQVLAGGRGGAVAGVVRLGWGVVDCGLLFQRF